MKPEEMAVELVRLHPRRPAVLNQAIQDFYGLSHYDAAGVLGRAMREGLIDIDWNGQIVVEGRLETRE